MIKYDKNVPTISIGFCQNKLSSGNSIFRHDSLYKMMFKFTKT